MDATKALPDPVAAAIRRILARSLPTAGTSPRLHGGNLTSHAFIETTPSQGLSGSDSEAD